MMQPEGENEALEDVTDRCLHLVITQGMHVLVTKKKINGNVKTIHLLDARRQYWLSKAQQATFLRMLDLENVFELELPEALGKFNAALQLQPMLLALKVAERSSSLTPCIQCCLQYSMHRCSASTSRCLVLLVRAAIQPAWTMVLLSTLLGVADIALQQHNIRSYQGVISSDRNIWEVYGITLVSLLYKFSSFCCLAILPNHIDGDQGYNFKKSCYLVKTQG
ncbi:hypothetical protein CK203_030257 [Vitis vinifera]|uniref:Uncharacterized protein n=1 Tax=Vitis vinifera TaxID=29760 RepID=A0A438I5C4_VITVI|nr:hypothetical protein CK203_030257 [Vitis vinifera]